MTSSIAWATNLTIRMNRREKISVYINTPTRSYLLCRVINMGDSSCPDLKFTDVSAYGCIARSGRLDGALAPDVKIDFATEKLELSYHKDGSPLYKSSFKGNIAPWRSNYQQSGFRQIPITDCNSLLPLVVFQIRRPEIYRSAHIDNKTKNNSNYICANDDLFDDKQTLFAVIYVRHKIHVPLAQVVTKDYYSDILVSLTSELDLCIYICRQNYPSPKPYYEKVFNSWITPYACNSVSFCDQQATHDELISKLNNNIFDRAFAYFISVLGDGHLFYLTEEVFLILDAIDAFFETIHNPIIHKPQFARFVLEIYKENKNEFISMPSNLQNATLMTIWNTIIKEGTQRNWFN